MKLYLFVLNLALINRIIRNFEKKVKMQTVIVTPKDAEAALFIKKILEDMNSVQSVRIIEDYREIPFVRLSESSLMKEWGSEEDNVYDDWANNLSEK
jgi:hypothetical protein